MAVHINKNLAHFRNTMVILVTFSFFKELVMNIDIDIVIFASIRTINTIPLLISGCEI
ncbi:hypothetical protein Ngar_c10800 [Candidatus Nitrososphaera gargensis Ga9.2]|uniref:Uncharacterized protein n=1 Tax=Nitrososphaera gargensis (strain Ga9.2) TaxID=1237085 RepID=K0IIT2_NITGG|nr:hypothetical protein Ngar_c10800 [Candidatus Nitrososphaera gargensis Ga9.2]